MTRRLLFIFLCLSAVTAYATTVHIANPDTWTADQLSPYYGQEITFDGDWYVCNNYRGTYIVSPRRIFSATNQTLPLSTEYRTLLSLNQRGTITLTGVSGYHRMGERLHNLTVYVNSSYSMRLENCTWRGNTRSDLEKGYDLQALDQRGKHNLLICTFNLQYYLVENLGTGFGPDTQAEHNAQRQKISTALAKINADIYGLLEIEQGQSALQELAADLSAKTGRHFTYIDDGSSPYSSYTKSGYIYCPDVVEPDGKFKRNNTKVVMRKFMQAFKMKSTGESFIFSINHFKAKSGTGTGKDADQGDGQGIFNATRVEEAQSVISEYLSNKNYFGDEDILIMGDLNAYAKEDPITTLTYAGMTDLHRYFHADSSYSYIYHGEAGYLDHALCNATLLPQVTGMTAYHINSDESTDYTYTSADRTMFRCSDHDPILVGLHLGAEMEDKPHNSTSGIFNTANLLYNHDHIVVRNAQGALVRIYDINGLLHYTEHITTADQDVDLVFLRSGMYIVHLYFDGEVQPYKILIR